MAVGVYKYEGLLREFTAKEFLIRHDLSFKLGKDIYNNLRDIALA